MMSVTRRGFVRAGVVVAGAMVAVDPLTEAGRAQAAATRTWLLPRHSAYCLANASLGGSAEVAESAFNRGTTWFTVRYEGAGPATTNPVPPGYSGVAVLKFDAYENGSTGLIDAIKAGLPSWVQAVQYDCESWAKTPPIEQGAWRYSTYAEASYAELFCQTAHSRGLRVVLTPSNDLCNNKPNSAYPGGQPQYPVPAGETNYQAYVRYDLALAAQWLEPGDVYEYQAQSLELDAVTYQSVTSRVASQVTAASTGVTLLAGIGRRGATWDKASAGQLTGAARSVTGVVAGFWPNIDADATRVKIMVSFLRNLGY
jgi:hypothetical protein